MPRDEAIKLGDPRLVFGAARHLERFPGRENRVPEHHALMEIVALLADMFDLLVEIGDRRRHVLLTVIKAREDAVEHLDRLQHQGPDSRQLVDDGPIAAINARQLVDFGYDREHFAAALLQRLDIGELAGQIVDALLYHLGIHLLVHARRDRGCRHLHFLDRLRAGDERLQHFVGRPDRFAAADRLRPKMRLGAQAVTFFDRPRGRTVQELARDRIAGPYLFDEAQALFDDSQQDIVGSIALDLEFAADRAERKRCHERTELDMEGGGRAVLGQREARTLEPEHAMLKEKVRAAIDVVAAELGRGITHSGAFSPSYDSKTEKRKRGGCTMAVITASA